MSATVQTRTPAAVDAQNVFSRVVVGIDPSVESCNAVRQTARLMGGAGYLELVAAYELAYPGVGSGLVIAPYTDHQVRVERERATSALARACTASGRDDIAATIVQQRPSDALLEEALRARATLIAVGSHGRGRTAGIVLGSVATQVIHRAPCSVLIARGALAPQLRRIVIGIDGSPESVAAYRVAADLAERTGAELWPVVAHGGRAVDHDAVDMLTLRREDSPDEPVKALDAAAADADLLVVGSRGLHGLRALGSVSERVAHEAQCSTLIVRLSP